MQFLPLEMHGVMDCFDVNRACSLLCDCVSQDLDCLNRDLSKVIMVDWNPNATELQPRNTLNIRKWTGDDEDRTLIDLAHFLRSECTLF